MKRSIAVILMIIMLLSGCKPSVKASKQESETGKLSSGVWLSYNEINGMLTSQNNFRSEVEQVLQNCKSLEIENIYIQVRPFCDSIFESSYFPLRENVKGMDFDIFEYMLNAFQNEGIKVHAWINPYRVYTASEDINAISPESPAYKWLNDESAENDRNVCFADGIYLNPAEAEVRALVIDGIREITERYSVDGIHFDDYFYPTTDSSFDSESYAIYSSGTEKPLSIEDWRRANVNTLISGCATAIRGSGKNITFSISPAASIDKNYNELFADVEYWVKNGLVDTVIPQLYFGFEYPLSEYRFETLLKSWKKLMSCNDEVKLIIGLASYKIGTDTAPDNEEWQRDTDIIARQAELCRKDDRISGYVLFSYSSIFSDGELNKAQKNALTEYIKTY